MGFPDELRPLRSNLVQPIRNTRGFYGVTTPRAPLWFGRLIADLTVAVDGLEIIHVSAHYDDGAGRVLVFTDALVVDSRVSDVEGDDAVIVTTVVSRSTLRSLKVSALHGAFDPPAFSTWPGALTVIPEYPGLDPIELPLDESAQPDEMRALYAALRHDLAD